MLLRSRPARALTAVAVLALAAAACGDDDDDATTETTAAPAGDTGDTGDTSDTGDTGDDDTMPAGASLVEVVDSSLGPILASDGRTLYTFTPDAGGASTCYDECAATWPPLLADGAVSVGTDLDAALFASTPRDDGGEQVTVGGWPLYFYAADAAPGDVNGQGVGDRWYVVGPDGVAIQDAAAPAVGGYGG